MAVLLGVGSTEMVKTGFEECGWLLTIHDALVWDRIEGLAAALGFSVTQGPQYSDPELPED